MPSHSEAVQIPVARLHQIAGRNRTRPVASIPKGSRMNAGGLFINNPFAALARAITGKGK